MVVSCVPIATRTVSSAGWALLLAVELDCSALGAERQLHSNVSSERASALSDLRIIVAALSKSCARFGSSLDQPASGRHSSCATSTRRGKSWRPYKVSAMSCWEAISSGVSGPVVGWRLSQLAIARDEMLSCAETSSATKAVLLFAHSTALPACSK